MLYIADHKIRTRLVTLVNGLDSAYTSMQHIIH